jgi:hypothetical protein
MRPNPYESPPPTGVTEPSIDGRARRSRLRPKLLIVPLAWTGLVFTTGFFADNIRFMTTTWSFILMALVIGAASVTSLVCLVLAIGRSWWHLLLLPLWFFLLTEVAVLAIRLILLVKIGLDYFAG